MIFQQTTKNFKTLLTYLSRKEPFPLKICSTVKVLLTGKLKQEILVDKWPEPAAIVIRPFCGQYEKYETERKIAFTYESVLQEDANEYSVYTDDATAMIPLIPHFDWSKEILFADLKLTSPAYGCIKEYASTRYGSKCWSETEPIMTYIAESDFDSKKEQSVSLPPELKLRKLDGSENSEDVRYINSVWKYGGSNYTRHFITSLIHHLPNYGLVKRESGNLVACVLTSADLSLAIGHVDESYRRCSLMTYLIRAVSADVRQQYDNTIYGHVSVNNAASRALMDAVKWRCEEGSVAVWARYRPQHHSRL